MINSDAEEDALKHLQSRILTHYAEAKMILEGKMPPPRTAIVYPTYVCNQNCLWCEYSEDNRDIHAVMTKEQLYQLIWDLHDLGVRGVEFCGGGEPTLHPSLTGLIGDMKAKGMNVGLLTNGTRLFGELAEALVECGSYVRVGLDGASAKTVDKVKRPSSREAGFDAVCENIVNLVALRNQRGGRLIISMKVVLDKNNYTEAEECVKLAAKLGVDSLQFKAARLCASELDARLTATVSQRLFELREDYPDVPIVGGVDKLNMERQCWLTPLQVMVDTLGEVYLCCYYRHRKNTHSIGNAFEVPMRDIWYSERHWEAIRAIKPAECNLLDCRFVNYNDIMTELVAKERGQFDFI